MRFWLLFSILLLASGLVAGCRKTPLVQSADPPPIVAPAIPGNTPEPHAILDQMVRAYQTAWSYSDNATVQIIGKMSQPGTEPAPWNCMVAFQKPNKLYLEIYDGTFASNGKDCFANIRSLPDQVLHFPAPEHWTLDVLFRDVLLDSAMELELPPSVLRFPPQLVLLFANNPLHTFCPKGAKVEWVGQQPLGQIHCDIIRISHSDGNRLLWISQDNQALLRLDYQPVGLPVPEGFESIEAIRVEMTNARFVWTPSSEPFPLHGAVRVAEFRSNRQGFPPPEEHQRRLELMKESDCYRIIDQHLESVTTPDQPPPKVEPQTFTLSRVWSLPLVGASTMAFLPDETPKLLIPHAGNIVAVLDLQGNVLQRIAPATLEDSIIVDIQTSNSLAGNQRIGLATLDKKVYLFDASFKPLAAYKEEIQDFQFARSLTDELLFLGIQQEDEQDIVQDSPIIRSVVRTVDMQGTKCWEYHFEGMLNQISSATMDNQPCVLVSCSAVQDSILIFSLEGTALEPVKITFGRNVIWFHALGSTIFTLWENTDTGNIWFVGLDRHGKGQWGRSLPSGEYTVEPIFIPNEKKWFVPAPSGEIFVFDLIGNMIDTFSLNIIPTGLLYVEVAGESLLVVSDGETISAWKIGITPGLAISIHDVVHGIGATQTN